MGSSDKKERKEKKRSEKDGVRKSKKEDKKDKHERQEKLAAAVESALETDGKVNVVQSETKSSAAPSVAPTGALLPIAIPLAEEKGTKKILKTIRKAAKNNALKRGVKEVTKTIRKSPAAGVKSTSFPGVVVLAGDIWPMDVISHLPVACEDHNIPYIYLRSRAELGDAASTKRPTSVVMIMEKAGPKKKGKEGKEGKEDKKEEDGESFADKYKSLVKLVQAEAAKQAFW